MKKDNKIILAVAGAMTAVAIAVLAFFGVHYAMKNPTGLILPPDMKTFTVVTGNDYTASEIASVMRAVRKQELSYMRINDKLYASSAENVYEKLNELMSTAGYEYIGCDGTLVNMRCFYKDGHAIWVRVEYDMNEAWTLWNLGSPFDYDLAKEGHKNMDY